MIVLVPVANGGPSLKFMKTSSVRAVFFAIVASLFVALSPTALSQQVTVARLERAVLSAPEAPASPEPLQPARPVEFVQSRPLSEVPHKFWDRQNKFIFAAVAVSSAADFAVTRSNLQNGGQELNPMTRVFGRSTAGLAANFAGETAGVIGIGYFLHKTGHHKLERLVPMANIGMSGFAVGYGLSH